jgi:hypothetical protein
MYIEWFRYLMILEEVKYFFIINLEEGTVYEIIFGIDELENLMNRAWNNAGIIHILLNVAFDMC